MQELQPQPQDGVKSPASVPFLYRQYKSAKRIGKPQPLNTFEQKIPSFEPRIMSAIRIQRVVLPDKQQFIENLLCFAAGVCKLTPKRKSTCGFFFLLHNIPAPRKLCKFFITKKEKMQNFFYFVA